MYRTQSVIAFTLCFCFQQSSSAEIQVTADFSGGSAVVVSTDSANQSVHIKPQVRPDQGWPCWWYFQITGLSTGSPVSVTVSANATPFRAGRVLNSSWLLPDSASISTDNIHWQHTPQAKVESGRAVYQFEATSETMWVAWGPPFLPSHAESLLNRIAKLNPDSVVFELARTRSNRPVHAIRFGAQSDDSGKRPAVWIQARQHAWESGSSWVAQGFLEWVASDDPGAIDLRNKAIICVVPIMDVDNVANGMGGKDAAPRDHNRDWDDDPIYPEVRAAQEAIKKLNENHRFDLFVDLHNPGPNDRKPYFYGPKLDGLPQTQYRNYIRWKEIAKTHIEHLESDYRFTSYIKTQEELDRVSKNWVRNHSSPHVIALTLETAWNRPQGTQNGYKQVGKQLGMTIASYLAGDVD